MSQTALHSHMVGFVGGTGPATGAQQHLQWCGLACDLTGRRAEDALLPAAAQGGFLQVPDLRASSQDWPLTGRI